MIAGAVGASSSSAGVGVANTTLIHTDNVIARLGANDAITGGGPIGVTISATSTEDIIALTAAGGVASSAGVAVAPTILILSETTTASIGAGATAGSLSLGAASNVSVIATDNADRSVVGSAASAARRWPRRDALSLIATNAFIDSGEMPVDGDTTERHLERGHRLGGGGHGRWLGGGEPRRRARSTSRRAPSATILTPRPRWAPATCTRTVDRIRRGRQHRNR